MYFECTYLKYGIFCLLTSEYGVLSHPVLCLAFKKRSPLMGEKMRRRRVATVAAADKFASTFSSHINLCQNVN